MQVDIGAPAARGHRPVKPARVQAERLAEAYSGLPDGATKWDLVRHLEAIPPHVLGLRSRQRMLLVLLVRLQAEELWRSRSWLAEHGCAFSSNDLICVASNPELALQLGVTERQVSRHLAALADAGLIAFRDSATRKRWRSRPSRGGVILEAYGIDLRPLAAQFERLAGLAGEADRDRAYIRSTRYRITCLLNRLAGLGARLELRDKTDEIVEARRLGERARKWSDASKVWSAHEELERRILELEDALLEVRQVIDEDVDYTGQHDVSASLGTYSPETRSSYSDSAWREDGVETATSEDQGVVAEPQEAEAGCEAPEHVNVPSPSQGLRTLPAILAAHRVNFIVDAGLGSPRGLVRAYGRQALRKIGLDPAGADYARRQLGEDGFTFACLMAAYDDRIRDKRAWVSGIARRAALIGADTRKGDAQLDLAKSWYGLWRRCLQSTVH